MGHFYRITLPLLALSLSGCTGIGLYEAKYKGEEYRGLQIPLTVHIPLDESTVVSGGLGLSTFTEKKTAKNVQSDQIKRINSVDVEAEYHKVLWGGKGGMLTAYGGLAYSDSTYHYLNRAETEGGLGVKTGLHYYFDGDMGLDIGYRTIPLGGEYIKAFSILLYSSKMFNE